MRIAPFIIAIVLGLGALAAGAYAYQLTTRDLSLARKHLVVDKEHERRAGQRGPDLRDGGAFYAYQRHVAIAQAAESREKVAKLEQERNVSLALFAGLGAAAFIGLVLSLRRRAVAPAGAGVGQGAQLEA